MRFSAPEHVSDVTLSTGPFPVVDGILEVPDDTPPADLDGLKVNGFTLLNEENPGLAKVKSPRSSAAGAAETETKGEEPLDVDPGADA